MKANKTVLIVLGVVLLCFCILVAIIAAIFVIGANSTSLKSSSPEQTLEKFLSSDTKYGKFSTSGTDEEGVRADQETGEYWVKGDEIRIDMYHENGDQRITIRSQDGIAYFCYIAEEYCEPSVVAVEYYQAMFNKPSVSAKSVEEDNETGCTRHIYEVDKTYDMSGSANKWFNHSVTYCTTRSDIKYIETQGTIPEDDGSILGYTTSRYLYSLTEIGLDIEDNIFELPFAVE